jgi:DNA-binding phage protein
MPRLGQEVHIASALAEPQIRFLNSHILVVGLLDAQARIMAVIARGVGVKTSSLEANLRKSGSPISLPGGLAVCE